MNHDDYIEYLVSQNALKYGDILPDGERSLEINADVLKVVAPELYKIWMEDLENTLMEMYKKGLIEVEYDEDLNVQFKIDDEIMPEFNKYGFYYNEDNGV